MREMPYIILALVVIVAAALFLGNSDPISTATSQAEANALLGSIPAGGWIASKLLSTLFSIVLSGIVVSIAGIATVQIRKWWRDHQYQPRWKSGPDAKWRQKAARQPKARTTEQMLQKAMRKYQTPPQSKASQQMPFIVVQQEPEEKLNLKF
jgi:hypothetical protein